MEIMWLSGLKPWFAKAIYVLDAEKKTIIFFSK